MRRSSLRLGLWTFGSLATAWLAHALILAASHLSPNTYIEHGHADSAIAGVAVTAAFAAALALVVVRVFAGSTDFVSEIMTELRRIDSAIAFASIGAGGALALFAMESLEQYQTLGRAGTCSAAFGGNAWLGCGAVVIVAFALAAIGRRFAIWVLGFTASSAVVLVSWIATSFARDDRKTAAVARRGRDCGSPVSLGSTLLGCSIHGLRAPPSLAGHAPT